MEHPAGRCGITFEKFQDIKEGDTVEAYVMEQIEVQSYPTAGRAVSPALLSLKREQAKKFCAKLRFASFVSVGGGTARQEAAPYRHNPISGGGSSSLSPLSRCARHHPYLFWPSAISP